VRNKIAWNDKTIVLSTFLEFPFNFPSNNIKNTRKFVTTREKNGVKV